MNNPVFVKQNRPLPANNVWTSIPARRPLYRLTASLHGFTVEAAVHPHGIKGFVCSVTVDHVNVPGYPQGGFVTLQAAITAAKAAFNEWVQKLLERV